MSQLCGYPCVLVTEMSPDSARQRAPGPVLARSIIWHACGAHLQCMRRPVRTTRPRHRRCILQMPGPLLAESLGCRPRSRTLHLPPWNHRSMCPARHRPPVERGGHSHSRLRCGAVQMGVWQGGECKGGGTELSSPAGCAAWASSSPRWALSPPPAPAPSCWLGLATREGDGGSRLRKPRTQSKAASVCCFG